MKRKATGTIPTNAEEDSYYEAMLARDYRFDGKFFIGVKTTGIYCRPICPAKPKRKNVEFFKDAFSAEQAGFRPCLRCRPESAPLSSVWIGKSAVVQRALRLMSENRHQDLDEDEFADLLGVSARHLRRLFEKELGKSPKQLSSDKRLGFARQLIVETELPFTEVAFSAGFTSIRRFNDAFKKRFHRAPTEIRRKASAPTTSSGVNISLPFRPPFDWKTIHSFYRSHLIPGVETITDASYSRHFRFADQIGFLTLTSVPKKSELLLNINSPDYRHLFQVVSRIRSMFDLDSDPLLISNAFLNCKLLSQLSLKHPGLRLPRAWDPFEVAIATILGQLVSVEHARGVVGQLVRSYGEKIKSSALSNEAYLFPDAKTLARESLFEIGTTQARRTAVREFSQLILENRISLSAAQDPSQFRKNLLEIKGIGPWTAEYIALRALGDPDSFPGTDLILKRALELNPTVCLDDVRPWRSYAAIYLWKEFATTHSKNKKRI